MCTFNGCPNPHYGNGLCKAHYMQQWRGEELKKLRRSPSDSRSARRAERHRERVYGLSSDDISAMMVEQGCRCAICGEPLNGRFHVDHDHSCCPSIKNGFTCGECVRGLLCPPCNFGLGHLGDDPDRLIAAAMYLMRTKDVIHGR